MQKLFVLTLAVTLAGCTGSLPEARDAGYRARAVGVEKATSDARCATLDDRRQFAGMVAKGAAVLAGASGLMTLPVDDRDARVALAAGSMGAAAIAAGAMVVAESAGESWARECSR